MKKLLLTGASGFLGWNICEMAQDHWQIEGTAHRHIIDLPGANLHSQDLTDLKATTELFRRIQPDAVIHTAAQSNANTCQQQPADAVKINVDAAIHLAKLAAEKDIPFVFTSSDLIFDGKKGNYTEADAPDPVSIYGEQKAQAEAGIREVYPRAAICRLPLMFGDGGPAGRNFLTGFLSNIKKGEPIQLFTDEYRTAIGGQSAAMGLLLAVEKLEGTYHLGGRDKLSRYEFGRLMQEVFNLDESLIHPSKQADVQMAAPRPADVSLNSEKAFAEGYQPLSNREELILLREILS